MAIQVNGAAIGALHVGSTVVDKVLARNNESSPYEVVYLVESKTTTKGVLGRTGSSVHSTNPTTYITPKLSSTITDSSGIVTEVTSATPITSNITGLSIDGTSISFFITGPNSNSPVTGEISVTYKVSLTNIPDYDVKQVSTTSSQQFILNSNGYYESNCKAINNGWSLCRIDFYKSGNYTLQCISNGENNYDFGILSTINYTLSASNTVDTSGVHKSFKGLSSTAVQTVTYNNVSGGDYIYVKYRKDSSVNSGNDSLQFKVVLAS
nr:MAG TPA: hypothetical protein [Caudoviricetes sp.]